MKLINFPSTNGYSDKPKVFALGKFGALHLGHRELFKKAREIANEKDYELAIMIFGENEKDNIFSLEERLMFLEEYKPDYIMLFEKSAENFAYSKDDFENILLNLDTKEIVVGTDFKYGKDRLGDVDSLKGNFNTTVIPDVLYKEEKISTTRVYESIKEVKLDDYKEMMGHHFFYKGKVVRGLGNGRKFGMPTANVTYPDNKIDIEDGIFYSYVLFNGARLPSLTSISYNPTLNATEKTYETFIYDFDEDIYDEVIYVELISKYRDSIKFETVDKLIDRLNNDKLLGKTFFNNLKQGKI